MLDELYQLNNIELKQYLYWFGYQYSPQEIFKHGKKVLVCRIKSDEGGDGQDVDIYETRMPAIFYEIEALETPDSIGERSNAFTLTTGTIDASLVAQIAHEIAEGGLGCKLSDIIN